MCLALNKWLKKNGLSQARFAKIYKFSQPFVNQLVNGRKRASIETCRQIALITNGEVTGRDLRPDLYVGG